MRRSAPSAFYSFLISLSCFSVLVPLATSLRSNALSDYRPFFRGARATGMGGAYVAIADDEQALFMNPAGLAGVKKLSFRLGSLDYELSTENVTLALSGGSAFSDLGIGTLNDFMGKDIYLRGQITPTLLIPRFGFGLISDHQIALYEQNQAYPQINLGYQSTNGIQFGFGTSLLGRRAVFHDLRIGLAGKIVWRRGGYRTLGFLDILEFSQDAQGYAQRMAGSYGVGYGVDLGLQYLTYPNKRFTLSHGLVMTDVGDTVFSEASSNTQKSNLTYGFGASYKLSRAKLIFAMDLKHLTREMEFKQRLHLGTELSLPFFGFFAGMGAMALSYGGYIDLWLARITGLVYGEELGYFAGQNVSKRYLLRMEMKFSF